MDKFKQKAWSSLSLFYAQLLLSAKQAIRSAAKNKCQYFLGSSSVLLVTVTITVLLTALSYSPSVFFSLAESSSGQIDLALSSSNGEPLNFTLVSEVMAESQNNALGFSRSLFTGRMQYGQVTTYKASTCIGYDATTGRNKLFYTGPKSRNEFAQYGINDRLGLLLQNVCLNTTDNSTQLSSFGNPLACMTGLCRGKPLKTNVYVIDSNRERDLKIGRAWQFQPLKFSYTGPNTPAVPIYIQQNVARSLNVGSGDYLNINFDNFPNSFPVLYQFIADAVTNTTGALGTNYNLEVLLKSVNLVAQVETVVQGTYGKTDANENAAVFFELDSFLTSVALNVHPYVLSLYDPLVVTVQNTSSALVNESITNILFSCGSNRLECYLSGLGFDDVTQKLIGWSSAIVFDLGFSALNQDLPVLDELAETQFFSAFLNLIFMMVVLIMGGMSVFLIYSLLMVSVENAQFELGVFRMIGMVKWKLIVLILVQGLSYSLPACLVGLIVGQVAWFILYKYLAELLQTEIQGLLTPISILVALLLGLIIPTLASIFPVKQALSENLHDALDTRRSKTKPVVITVERARGQTISYTMLFSGSIMVVLGFVIYYFLPLALVYENISLLFNIFLLLLLGMMLGLVLLSLNLEPLLTRALVFIGFFLLQYFEIPSMSLLVRKNLLAHKIRNRKTFILYALSLGFIIFLTVGIRVQLQSLIFLTRRDFAGEIRVQAGGWNQQTMKYAYPQLRSALTENPDVAFFSYKTFDISTTRGLEDNGVENFGRIQSYSNFLSAVSPNHFDVFDPSFFVLSSAYYDENARSFSEGVYTIKGSSSVYLGSIYQTQLNILSFFDDFVIYSVRGIGGGRSNTTRTSITANAFLASSPGLFFSGYPTSRRQDIVMALPLLYELTNNSFSVPTAIPMQRIYIRLMPNLPQQRIQATVDELTKVLQFETVSYVEDQLQTIYTASNTLSWLFQVITVLILCVAFFSLNSSMFTNIMEQSKEIGVLLSLGASHATVYRLFAYEAFFLVFSGSLMGFAIGCIMGWSMSAQRSVVTQVPIEFLFPWDIFLLTCACSIVCAIVSTVIPLKRLFTGRRIVNLLR